ncbi:MAG: FkbM family methyltransferase [Hyphomonadaceae bacterium JAD_PAG50586_4]|nr:MAG: FkbM family methyltransferase [Hyphomonadaceae bacterium JAD_PAG50586_4]
MASHLVDQLLRAIRIVGLDIGARGGFTTDLSPIGAAVEAIGFEPDSEECDRLNASVNAEASGLRALRYIPTAVGRADEERMLNLYRARGCSSLLTADPDFAALYARDDYFILDGQVRVRVERLDAAAERFGFTDAHYMKIDIQGAELEAMQSAPNLVSHLLAIRSEVEFAPIYQDQPLFADVDAELRAKGFMLARFPQLHAWRRGTKVRNDRWAPGPVPLSEGQLIHGDVLYLRRPELMAADTETQQDRLIALALIAYAYGHVDLSGSVLTRPEVAGRLKTMANVEANALVAELGRLHVARRRKQLRRLAFSGLRGLIQ